MQGSAFGHSPRACLVYITTKKVEKGKFLRASYEPKNKGVLTAEDRRDRGGMNFANQ